MLGFKGRQQFISRKWALKTNLIESVPISQRPNEKYYDEHQTNVRKNTMKLVEYINRELKGKCV